MATLVVVMVGQALSEEDWWYLYHIHASEPEHHCQTWSEPTCCMISMKRIGAWALPLPRLRASAIIHHPRITRGDRLSGQLSSLLYSHVGCISANISI